MDIETRRMAAELRRMSSGEAAQWLLTHFPREQGNWGTAIALLDHLSLARKDNLALARHYLTALPFASGRCYEVFARRLRVPDLVKVIGDNLPSDESDLDLLLYYLEPVLKGAVKSPEGERAVTSLLARVDALKGAAAGRSSTLH